MQRHCNGPPTMLGISQIFVRVFLAPHVGSPAPIPAQREIGKSINCQRATNQRQAGLEKWIDYHLYLKGEELEKILSFIKQLKPPIFEEYSKNRWFIQTNLHITTPSLC